MANVANAGGEREDEAPADRRHRRRFAAMWDGASDLFERHFGVPQQAQAPAAPPPPRRHFTASTCIELLNVLPPNEASLRRSALNRLRSFMAQDQAADDADEGHFDDAVPARHSRYSASSPPTSQRPLARRRVRPATPDQTSEAESSSSSSSSSSGSSSGS